MIMLYAVRMRLVFISSVMATTELRITSAEKASTFALLGISEGIFHSSIRRHRLAAATLPDHLIRPHQHVGWNRQTDLLGRFQVDDELKLHRLLHGEVGGLPAFEDFVDISRSATE